MRRSALCLNRQAFWVMPLEKVVGREFEMLLREPIRVTRPSADHPSGRESLNLVARQTLMPYWDENRKEYRCRTKGYMYTLADSEQKEMFSWHWHPATYAYPHLHVKGGKDRAHVPSGRVTFESVARFVIHDLGATPATLDWAEVLDTQEELHRQFRTWS